MTAARYQRHEEQAIGRADVELVDWLEELNQDGFFFLSEAEQAFSDNESGLCFPDPKPVAKSTHSLQCFVKVEPPSVKVEPQSPCSRPAQAETGSIARPKRALTAMQIFNSFTKKYVNEFGQPIVDCSGIISRPCYELWLTTRKKEPSRPEECYRKCILAHCTASDGGSAPFPRDVEASLLRLLRQPGKVWPCFQGCMDKAGRPVRIGAKGLRAVGYHEKQTLKRTFDDASTSAAAFKRVKF